jgi:hypothetical protein
MIYLCWVNCFCRVHFRQPGTSGTGCVLGTVQTWCPDSAFVSFTSKDSTQATLSCTVTCLNNRFSYVDILPSLDTKYEQSLSSVFRNKNSMHTMLKHLHMAEFSVKGLQGSNCEGKWWQRAMANISFHSKMYVIWGNWCIKQLKCVIFYPYST